MKPRIDARSPLLLALLVSLSVFCTTTATARSNKPVIVGRWRAEKKSEGGKSVRIDPRFVLIFVFRKDGRFKGLVKTSHDRQPTIRRGRWSVKANRLQIDVPKQREHLIFEVSQKTLKLVLLPAKRRTFFLRRSK